MELEDSSSSFSSCSTLSCEPMLGGSADLEAGFLSSTNTRATAAMSFPSSDVNPYALSAPRRSGFAAARNRRWPHRRFFNEYSEYDVGHQHFLDSCFLCKKPLSGNRDIFMYRGDLPFCSEECRQQQIEMDEARENANSVAAVRASSRRELQKEVPQSSPKSQKARARAGSIQLVG